MYINQGLVKETFQQTFPGEFDNYLSNLLNYNNEDICALYYSYNATLQQGKLCILKHETYFIQGCNDVGGQQGLIQSEVTFVETLKSAMAKFYNTTGRDVTTKHDTISGPSFGNACK